MTDRLGFVSSTGGSDDVISYAVTPSYKQFSQFRRQQMASCRDVLMVSERRKASTTDDRHLIAVSSLAVNSEHSFASVRLLCGSNSS